MTVSLDRHSAQARIGERDFGLTTDIQRRVNQMLQDYDRNLSLRAIPERDPAFRPPRTMGVYEEGTKGVTPWVFTIEPEHVDERVFARAIAGDMSKLSHAQRMEILKATRDAAARKIELEQAEEAAQRREEMLFIASTKQNTIRHKINGETVILADEPGGRRTKTFIV